MRLGFLYILTPVMVSVTLDHPMVSSLPRSSMDCLDGLPNTNKNNNSSLPKWNNPHVLRSLFLQIYDQSLVSTGSPHTLWKQECYPLQILRIAQHDLLFLSSLYLEEAIKWHWFVASYFGPSSNWRDLQLRFSRSPYIKFNGTNGGPRHDPPPPI